MSKTLIIELPDDLQQHLGLSTDTPDDSLRDFILKSLNTLAVLMGELQNTTDPILRAQAAIKLGDMQADAAVDVLAQALDDDEVVVRHSATEALRKIGTDNAMALLSQHDSELDLDYGLLLSLAGTLDLGTTDLGEKHDKYIAEALEQELRPDN